MYSYYSLSQDPQSRKLLKYQGAITVDSQNFKIPETF